MKIRLMAVIVLTMTGTAAAHKTPLPTGPVVQVCVQSVVTRANMFYAEDIAGDMFATAGINIRWRKWDGCPADALRITLSQDAAATDHPDSYAYALPFEGTHIVVFLSRITSIGSARGTNVLLAHVIVHEITHILQGTQMHSETGVMKAVFANRDIAEMELHPLPFTPFDVQALLYGLSRRDALLASARVTQSAPVRGLGR